MSRVLVTFHSALLSVGSMEHSDSESDFELQRVDPGLDGLSDEPSETSLEEQDIGGHLLQLWPMPLLLLPTQKKQMKLTSFFK